MLKDLEVSILRMEKRKGAVGLPMVMALAKMTPERMNTMREALPNNVISFLTKYCPQKPANIETDMRYSAAEGEKGDNAKITDQH